MPEFKNHQEKMRSWIVRYEPLWGPRIHSNKKKYTVGDHEGFLIFQMTLDFIHLTLL